jgi:hypothetical protein
MTELSLSKFNYKSFSSKVNEPRPPFWAVVTDF